jgi:hypothetical protein
MCSVHDFFLPTSDLKTYLCPPLCCTPAYSFYSCASDSCSDPTFSELVLSDNYTFFFLFFGTRVNQCSAKVPTILSTMNTTKIPRLRHRSSYLEPIESRKAFVVPRGHTPQLLSLSALIIEAPVYSRKGARYDSHEILYGGVTRRTSISEQVTALLAMPALIIADER